MNVFLGLLLLLTLAFAGLYIFVNVKPANLARALRTFTTTFAALAGTGLLLTGRIGLALIIFLAAVMAFRALRGGGHGGFSGTGSFGGDGSDGSSSAKRSTIATDMLSMQLDHRTGDLDGEVLAGRFAGRSLESLSLRDLLALLVICERDDPRAVPLLETYLDRRHPDWQAEVNGRGRESAGRGSESDAHASGGSMDAATACLILEVPPDADADQIKAAHRRLMNKLHPDHGGSGYLAAQLNQAKDVLLRR